MTVFAKLTLNELRISVREPMYVFFTVLFPILLIVILGNVSMMQEIVPGTGGLRVLENAMRYKERGADRLIFGTAAVARPGVVQEAVHKWPGAVVVALDARNGTVTVAGWQELTTTTALELAQRVRSWGVTRVQYTDVLRDGALTGPNIEAVAELARASRRRTEQLVEVERGLIALGHTEAAGAPQLGAVVPNHQRFDVAAQPFGQREG